MAALLGTAAWLKQHEQLPQRPAVLLWQPAEEGGFGAGEMIRDGALERVSSIFGWHNWPMIEFGKIVCPSAPVMAATGSFQITLICGGGYASQPEAFRDPVQTAAELMRCALQLVWGGCGCNPGPACRRWHLRMSVSTLNRFPALSLLSVPLQPGRCRFPVKARITILMTNFPNRWSEFRSNW